MTYKFWVATVKTAHFSWEGYGHSRAEAEAALLSAWHEHARQTGGPGEDLYTDAEMLADAFTREVQAGQGYRDGEACGSQQADALATARENEAIEACTAARLKVGRNWKQAVRLAWETGAYDHAGLSDLAGALQRTRNVFGPSWLNRLRLPVIK